MPKTKTGINFYNKKSNKKYNAVIFDFHFTLAHFYPSREKIYRMVIKKYGFLCSSQDIARAFSKTWMNYTDIDLINAFSLHVNKSSMEKWWLKFHSKVFLGLGIKDKKLLKLINNDISNLVYKDNSIYRLYPDVINILTILKRHGVKIGIITNAHKTIRKIIRDLGLTNYFDCVTISCEVGLSKPNPDIFRYTFKRMGVNVENVLYVGDGYHTDVIGSESVGCDLIIINRKDKNGKKQNKYPYINNLSQIKKIIFIK